MPLRWPFSSKNRNTIGRNINVNSTRKYYSKMNNGTRKNVGRFNQYNATNRNRIKAISYYPSPSNMKQQKGTVKAPKLYNKSRTVYEKLFGKKPPSNTKKRLNLKTNAGKLYFSNNTEDVTKFRTEIPESEVNEGRRLKVEPRPVNPNNTFGYGNATPEETPKYYNVTSENYKGLRANIYQQNFFHRVNSMVTSALHGKGILKKSVPIDLSKYVAIFKAKTLSELRRVQFESDVLPYLNQNVRNEYGELETDEKTAYYSVDPSKQGYYSAMNSGAGVGGTGWQLTAQQRINQEKDILLEYKIQAYDELILMFIVLLFHLMINSLDMLQQKSVFGRIKYYLGLVIKKGVYENRQIQSVQQAIGFFQSIVVPFLTFITFSGAGILTMTGFANILASAAAYGIPSISVAFLVYEGGVIYKRHTQLMNLTEFILQVHKVLFDTTNVPSFLQFNSKKELRFFGIKQCQIDLMVAMANKTAGFSNIKFRQDFIPYLLTFINLSAAGPDMCKDATVVDGSFPQKPPMIPVPSTKPSLGPVRQPANTASVSLEERRPASPVSPFGSNNEEEGEEEEEGVSNMFSVPPPPPIRRSSSPPPHPRSPLPSVLPPSLPPSLPSTSSSSRVSSIRPSTFQPTTVSARIANIERRAKVNPTNLKRRLNALEQRLLKQKGTNP